MFSRPGTIFHSFACSISDTLPKSGLFIPEQSWQYSENENVSYRYLHRKTEAREGKKGEMEREKIPNRGWKQLNQIGLSCLFLSHITILILMRLPVFPTCFFSPSDDLNIKKNLKSANSRSCVSQFDLEPHSRHQPWQTRCSKHAGAAFIRVSWWGFFTVWHHQPMPSAFF